MSILRSGLVGLFTRVYRTLVNGRSPLGLVLNFALNFSVLFLWLFTFKNAGLIPTEWRPDINVSILKNMDSMLFTGFSGIMFGLVFTVLSFYLALRVSKQDNRPLLGSVLLEHQQQQDGVEEHKYDEYEHSAVAGGSREGFNESMSTVVEPTEPISKHTNINDNINNTNENGGAHLPLKSLTLQTLPDAGSDSLSTATISTVSTGSTVNIGERPGRQRNQGRSDGEADGTLYLSKKKKLWLCVRGGLGYWKLMVGSSAWLWLNVMHMGACNYATVLDIGAWLSYVILHLAAPIITACYLWLFAPPGAMGSFALNLGLQNMLGVSTHLLFPTAPPWYNNKYGYLPGNYSMPGYAAGLTRVDVALGTHLNSNGFHKSPIVFGAFPSLHSAFVCLIFLYLSRYTSLKLFSRTWLPTIGCSIAFVFVLWQWWATMYLDHHYRLDLLGGAIYAFVTFTLFLPYLKRKDTAFVESHENLDLESHEMVKTGGMRLFENTCLEGFFNPLERSLIACFGSTNRFSRTHVYSRANRRDSQSYPYDYYQQQHKSFELDTLV